MEICFEDLKKANESIKTTDVKGKAYAEVNQRIKAFRMIFPTGQIITELISMENGICIFKAEVRDSEGNILGTGTAYEKEGSSFINKTSYIENCETSAVGRALGMAGFGIDVSVASYEEVANAIQQQESDIKIDKIKLDALKSAIKKNEIPDNMVKLVILQYGYKKLEEIKMKDYMQIVNDFKTKIKE